MEHENGASDANPRGDPDPGLAREAAEGFAGHSAGDLGWDRVEATEIYRELRRLAGRELRRFPKDAALGVSSVVNRLFVRLAARMGDGPADANRAWASKAHFYCAAAKAMRHVIIDDYRRRPRHVRGTSGPHPSLDRVRDPIQADPALMLDLDEAMRELEAIDPEAHRVIELRFFGGLSSRQIAEVLEVSERTVQRHTNAGRAWLARRLEAWWSGEP